MGSHQHLATAIFDAHFPGIKKYANKDVMIKDIVGVLVKGDSKTKKEDLDDLGYEITMILNLGIYSGDESIEDFHCIWSELNDELGEWFETIVS